MQESVKNERKLHVPIADRADVDLLKYLEETTRFIRAALKEEEGNVVLVRIPDHYSPQVITFFVHRSTVSEGSPEAPQLFARTSSQRRTCHTLKP
jgi:hypothetical protein